MPSNTICKWLRKALDDPKLARVDMELGVDPSLAAFHA